MTYYSLLLVPAIISLLAIPVLNRISTKINFFDFPEGDNLKIHKHPISCFGGLAIVIAVIFGLMVIAASERIFIIRIVGVCIGSISVFLLGFWDDLKWKHILSIKPYKKFILLILSSVVASLSVVFSGLISFHLGLFLSAFICFVYIFIFINAVNYQDGIDGLAGGLVLISAFGFFVLSMARADVFSLSVSVVLIGAVLGFLIYNFPPAKIFMGDSGAYFLGFILAVLTLHFFRINNFLSILSPISIFGFPLIEGILTNLRRLFSGNSIFHGDRMHLHDRMVNKNISTRKVIFIIYSVQIILVSLGVAIGF